MPYLDRSEEMRRLKRLYQSPQGRLAVLYGRRRCGKSRLIFESVAGAAKLVYCFGDEREPAVHRASLAADISTVIPGFDEVRYPDWESILARWGREAPAGTVLALDEFPNLVSSSRELPSLLQKHLDQRSRSAAHLILCGSSQRMMQGLVLDRSAPLYGRAQEILRISPLGANWLKKAFVHLDPVQQIEAYSVWGGVPRYWELAREFPTQEQSWVDLILSPLGVLHDEPRSLLQDDLSDAPQSASLLQLIGQGCHRLTELAGRLEKPPTSLNRPIQRLVELELICRDKPFGTLEKNSKRSYYRIADPFLRFWYRYVARHRSLLQAGQLAPVLAAIHSDFPHHVGSVWEDLVRAAIPFLSIGDQSWGLAQRWWGPGLDRKPLEIDVVAESLDGSSLILASVKWQANLSPQKAWSELRSQAQLFPETKGKRVYLALFHKGHAVGTDTFGPEQVLGALP